MTKTTSVSLGSALDIVQVSSLKSRLSKALAKNLSIQLVADKVEKADTAGLQLIYAFIQKAQQKDHSVCWKKPSDALLQASEILGMRNALNLN